jgi:hypothetical protein
MDTRHANLLATAHFLKTKTEPVLFYKPWQLRSEDEAIIRDQIREAEATIAREIEEYEASNSQGDTEQENKPNPPTETSEQAQTSNEDMQEPSTLQTADADAGANGTNHDKDSKETKPESPSAPNNEVPVRSTQEDDHRAEDDGGEVMEDNEDTVIY